MRVKNRLVDAFFANAGELIRFVFTGALATLCNMAVVWVCRGYLPASFSLACGLIAGLAVSFVLMKVYAFKATGWTRAKGEMMRFLLVYAFGTCAYLVAAMTTERLLSGASVSARPAAVAGVFVGGLLMAGSSYFGHRNFTYRRSGLGDRR